MRRFEEHATDLLILVSFSFSAILNFAAFNGLRGDEIFVVLLFGAGFLVYALCVAFLMRYVYAQSLLRLSVYASSIFVTIFLYPELRGLLWNVGQVELPVGQALLTLVIWLLLALGLGAGLVFVMERQVGRLAVAAMALVLLVNPVFFIVGQGFGSRSVNGSGADSGLVDMGLFSPATLPTSILEVEPRADTSGYPNIYMLSVDSYPPARVLAREHRLDNTEFFSALRARGFEIADGARSNFPATIYSVNTTMNMAYHRMVDARSEAEAIAAYQSKGFVGTISEPSIATTELKRRGYSFVLAENGFLGSIVCSDHVDTCINEQLASSELVSAIIQTTPLIDIFPHVDLEFAEFVALFSLRRASDFQASSRLIFESYTIDEVALLDPSDLDEPFLFLTHVVGMHNLGWDRNCDFIALERPPTVGEQAVLFRHQLGCLNSQILTGVDAILARDPSAIVFLLADHGTTLRHSQSRRPPDEWIGDADAVDELFGILLGLRVPTHCSPDMYNDMTPVNAMRRIFSCVDGEEHPLVPDRSFLFSVRGWTADPYFRHIDGEFAE